MAHGPWQITTITIITEKTLVDAPGCLFLGLGLGVVLMSLLHLAGFCVLLQKLEVLWQDAEPLRRRRSLKRPPCKNAPRPLQGIFQVVANSSGPVLDDGRIQRVKKSESILLLLRGTSRQALYQVAEAPSRRRPRLFCAQSQRQQLGIAQTDTILARLWATFGHDLRQIISRASCVNSARMHARMTDSSSLSKANFGNR
jgi:hypothetical protein